MSDSPKVLILAGGGTGHLKPFIEAAQSLNAALTVASFSDIEYITDGKLTVEGEDIANFDVLYIRLVGKRSEDAAFVVNYAKENGVRIVDTVYQTGDFVRLPLAKSIEARVLTKAGIPVPKTYFSSLENITENGESLLGFPFVIKGTMGKQGKAVWSPRDHEELTRMIEVLIPRERAGERFIAQEFIEASQRSRVFVVGDKALGAITRPMRWRRRFINKVEGEFPEGKKEVIKDIPKEAEAMAVAAAKALGIDVAGVDLIKEDKSGKIYIMEVNSAPGWKSIKKDTGIDIEKEILKYLLSLK